MSKEKPLIKKLHEPDLVIHNSKIITMDEQFSIVDSLAVKDGKIVALGSKAEIQGLIGANTQVLDLQGKTLLPGIIDHHIHPFHWAATIPPLAIDVSWPKIQSISDLLTLLKKKVEASEPGAGLFGFGLDVEKLKEIKENKDKQLTRWDLDRVSPNNPVCLHDHQEKCLWANSKALELACITKGNPDTPGCLVHKDPTTGEPTGFLEMDRLTNLMMIGNLLPLLTMKQLREGTRTALKALNAYGITSIVEGALGPGNEWYFRGVHDTKNLRVLNELHQAGKLNVRTSVLLNSPGLMQPGATSLENLKTFLNYMPANTGFGDDWLRIAGFKLVIDLVHFNKTAWMWDEYVGGGGKGFLLLKGENEEERYQELMEMIEYAHHQRWQIGIHAIGDRAIDAAVDGFIKALEKDPWDARHYLIHANFVRPETAQRMARYHIGASINSPWVWWHIFAEMDEAPVGPERDALTMPMRTLLDAGVRVANGSDAPATDPDWRIGVQAAVTRICKLTGKIRGPEQRVTVAEALRSYTLDAAYLDHQDHLKGSIEAGKVADFCVLGEDILSVDPEKINQIPILKTIVDGRVAYDGG